MKFAPEGFPFMAFFGLLSIGLWLAFGRWYALPVVVLFVFMFVFFRDPDRVVPDGEGLYVSPADGKIIVIRQTREEGYLDRDATQISIFMSPLNVHVNRAPCASEVLSVTHTPGGKHKAYTEEAYLHNENIAMVIKEAGTGQEILLRQVAGTVARRAVCRVQKGDWLKRGERYGIIKFSSRVDIYLPPDVEVSVGLDDPVRAGETVLAKRRGKE